MTETFTKPAIEYQQSGRTCWATTFTVAELRKLRPPREPENLSLFTETNRPINRRHLDGLSRFLLDTPDWALPPIVLSAAPGAVASQRGKITMNADSVQTLDGQHRLQAFAQIYDRLELDAATDPSGSATAQLRQLKTQELPVAITEVATNTEHRQIFAWFARTKPIDSATREFFDQSNPFGKAAKTAMDASAVLMDRVTWKDPSVPRKGADSRKLLSLKNLKEIATVIQLGVSRAPKAADREAAWEPETQARLASLLSEFFDVFLPSCQPNYQLLDELPQLESRILSHRQRSYALDPMAIRLIINAWARWKIDRNRDPEILSPVIGQLNLQRADPGNDMVNRLAVVTNPGLKFEKLRSSKWDEATSAILQMAQEHQPAA